jgi:hypothetical protein
MTATDRRELKLPGDTITLRGGARLKFRGWLPTGTRPQDRGKAYIGPNDLHMIISIDDHGEPWGKLLHMTLSYPRGFPDWPLIYDLTRAVFGEDIDTMMPIPREEAFIHGVTASQKKGTRRQVMHIVSFPEGWPRWTNEN